MLTNYHSLAYVASDLNSRLRGRPIDEAFSQEKDEVVVRFTDYEPALIVSCDRIMNAVFLRKEFARSRANSVNVLLPCAGQIISEVRIHPVDRVIMMKFESGKRLDVRLFGSKANVVLVEESEMVVDAFKDVDSIAGRKTDYRSGELIYDVEALQKYFVRPQLMTLAAILKEEFPSLGKTLVRELLHRAHLPSNLGAMSVSEVQIKCLQQAVLSVLKDLSSPQPRVYIYTKVNETGMPAAFSIVPLSHLEETREEIFTDVHDAIRFFVSATKSRENIVEQKKSLLGKLTQKITRAKRTIEAVTADLQSSHRADEYQRFGNLLMQHLDNIPSNADLVSLADENDTIAIPLQKRLSAVQNAQRYFEKAKRSRLAQKEATTRLQQLRVSIAPAEKLTEIIDGVHTRTELKQFMSDYQDELEELGIGAKSDEREQLPFRIFTVEGGFEVWAGKSSRNNDQLTLKYAKPDDLWFHARGAAGSHVVLKVSSAKGEPGKKAKEQAASIAAYYSKMKNAKMVPVAMTEKKYVRKPKGAAPGSVTVEREKVIFAEPALPREVKE